jgi:hypothetical protein
MYMPKKTLHLRRSIKKHGTKIAAIQDVSSPLSEENNTVAEGLAAAIQAQTN